MTDMHAWLGEYRGCAGRSRPPCCRSRRRWTAGASASRSRCTGWSSSPAGTWRSRTDGSTRLGQLLSLELRQHDATTPEFGQIHIRAGGGDGVILNGDDSPFHDASVRGATPDEVGAWLEGTRPNRAQLDVGELALAPGVPFFLDAGGFGHHTFLCGQSGSGKTYSLGLLLERLLMETNLRVVVSTRTRTTCASASRAWTTSAPETRRPRCRSGAAPAAPNPISVRFRDLGPAHQAGLVRLDPLADRAEYGELWVSSKTNRSAASGTRESASQHLKLRARRIGIVLFLHWPESEAKSLLSELASLGGPRCLGAGRTSACGVPATSRPSTAGACSGAPMVRARPT